MKSRELAAAISPLVKSLYPERHQEVCERVLVLAEKYADILRELIDGSIGRGPGDPDLAALTAEGRTAHARRVDAAARAASGQEG